MPKTREMLVVFSFFKYIFYNMLRCLFQNIISTFILGENLYDDHMIDNVSIIINL